jgi:hypothetical protein
MKKVASKKDAVALIKRAVAAGFSREVEVLKICNRRYAVMVSLHGVVAKGMIHDWVNVQVTFRLSGARRSVVIASRPHYSITRRRLWDAEYVVSELIDTAKYHGVTINA